MLGANLGYEQFAGSVGDTVSNFPEGVTERI